MNDGPKIFSHGILGFLNAGSGLLHTSLSLRRILLFFLFFETLGARSALIATAGNPGGEAPCLSAFFRCLVVAIEWHCLTWLRLGTTLFRNDFHQTVTRVWPYHCTWVGIPGVPRGLVLGHLWCSHARPLVHRAGKPVRQVVCCAHLRCFRLVCGATGVSRGRRVALSIQGLTSR
ncbi:hypothetical protein AVEN_146549-1 [Araneus ventricosus]|uniref:Uncharacterized protein n=1 Tax=Araneus ventricosus TaxID=182803 RepID=A0A4Y2U7D5_ARAVE|nr:hypothetical protein AVEN_146549-1 [Araneus ventricosus]